MRSWHQRGVEAAFFPLAPLRARVLGARDGVGRPEQGLPATARQRAPDAAGEASHEDGGGEALRGWRQGEVGRSGLCKY
jgi:hypothetical protein